MQTYPLFLNLQGRSALIIGAGSVGLRKLQGLLPCGLEEILVLDSNPACAAHMPDAACVHFDCRQWTAQDLQGRALVFACSGERELNSRVASLCREHGIFCNVADAPDEGSFQVPALYTQGDFSAAFSTNGASPALARKISREVAERYEGLLVFMARLRPLVLQRGTASKENAILFRRVVESELAGLLATKSRTPRQQAQLVNCVTSLLPLELHPYLTELLAGL